MPVKKDTQATKDKVWASVQESCNTFTKFSDLVAKADAIDAPFVATGHYARVAGGALHRGADDAKDQSYFLWGIDRAVLPGEPGRVDLRVPLAPLGALAPGAFRLRVTATDSHAVATTETGIVVK